MVRYDIQDAVEQVAPLRAVAPSLVARLREGLAGEACAQDVVRRDVPERNVTDVPMWAHAEVGGVELGQASVHLGGKDALMAEASQCKVKPTKAREEVDEPHGPSLATFSALKKLVTRSASLSRSSVSHSQTTRTFQPSAFSCSQLA